MFVCRGGDRAAAGRWLARLVPHLQGRGRGELVRPASAGLGEALRLTSAAPSRGDCSTRNPRNSPEYSRLGPKTEIAKLIDVLSCSRRRSGRRPPDEAVGPTPMTGRSNVVDWASVTHESVGVWRGPGEFYWQASSTSRSHSATHEDCAAHDYMLTNLKLTRMRDFSR